MSRPIEKSLDSIIFKHNFKKILKIQWGVKLLTPLLVH